MSLESSKTLSGVGAILIAVGSFTSLSGFMGILSLIGIILVLIGMKGLADFYGEKGIFDNALYGFIFGIISVVVAIALFVTALLSGISWSMDMMSEMGKNRATIGGLLLGWITFVVFVIVEAIFYRKAFSLLSEKSGEKMFDTAGLILLIGAVLTIILIGAILTLIAWILAAVAFFSIKPPPTTEQPQAPTSFTT